MYQDGGSGSEREGDKGISIGIEFEQWRRLTECKGEREGRRDKGGSFLAGPGPMSVSFPITLTQRGVNPPSQPRFLAAVSFLSVPSFISALSTFLHNTLHVDPGCCITQKSLPSPSLLISGTRR